MSQTVNIHINTDKKTKKKRKYTKRKKSGESWQKNAGYTGTGVADTRAYGSLISTMHQQALQSNFRADLTEAKREIKDLLRIAYPEQKHKNKDFLLLTQSGQ